MRTKITAHRGYWKHCKENSVEAFQKALELRAERIELDLHYSKDGRLVVHHDYYARLKNDTLRPILETAMADLAADVPLLSDVLELVGKSVELEIELKGISEPFLDAVIRTIKDFQVVDRVEFTSPHQLLLRELRDRLPSVTTGLFVQPYPDWMQPELGEVLVREHMRWGKLDVAHCPLSIITPELIGHLRCEGRKIHAADCNLPAELEQAFLLEVDQLSTNELETALRIREEVSRRPEAN